MAKKMNAIEKLIAELCPEGVQLKTLGEVAKILRGASPRPIAKYITSDENGIPWIKIGDTSPSSKYVSRTAQKITPAGAKKSRILKKGDFIMSNSMSFGRPYILNIDGAIHDGWASISDFEDKLNSDYLFHYLSSDSVQSYWISKINSGSVSNLNADIIKTLQIPIPPLPIQQEIVKILDTFTILEAELEAELEARKKQYEYYRDELLTFGDEVCLPDRHIEWKTLGEIGSLIRGNGLQKKDFVEDGIGCIHYGQIYTYYGTFAEKTKTFVSPELAKKLKKAQNGDVLISGVSENIEDVCKPLGWLGGEICISGDMFAFRHNQNTKYITYLLQTTRFKKYKERYAHGAKVIRVKQDKILDFKVPIPPHAEQERIVAILDKFDALVNDISVGLPAELDARRKQYEYYRNKLLTFDKYES